jgi:hypothetical protein
MKKVILSTVAIAALLAFGGCAEKKSCNKKVTPIAKKAPVVAKPAPAPVIVAPAAPAIIVEEAAPAIIEEPMADPKEACVR